MRSTMNPKELMEQVIVGSQQHGVLATPVHSVGDLFIFIGLLVCIGAIGIYAAYRIFKELF
jgi:hypothetical protein